MRKEYKINPHSNSIAVTGFETLIGAIDIRHEQLRHRCNFGLKCGLRHLLFTSTPSSAEMSTSNNVQKSHQHPKMANIRMSPTSLWSSPCYYQNHIVNSLCAFMVAFLCYHKKGVFTVDLAERPNKCRSEFGLYLIHYINWSLTVVKLKIEVNLFETLIEVKLGQ